MYLNILSEEQEALLPWLKKYRNKFVLVGGTAIALQIGHRRSIDFDLFCTTPINKAAIKKSLKEIKFEKRLLFEDGDGLHYLVNNVKITFFHYPFPIKGSLYIEDIDYSESVEWVVKEIKSETIRERLTTYALQF